MRRAIRSSSTSVSDEARNAIKSSRPWCLCYPLHNISKVLLLDYAVRSWRLPDIKNWKVQIPETWSNLIYKTYETTCSNVNIHKERGKLSFASPGLLTVSKTNIAQKLTNICTLLMKRLSTDVRLYRKLEFITCLQKNATSYQACRTGLKNNFVPYYKSTSNHASKYKNISFSSLQMHLATLKALSFVSIVSFMDSLRQEIISVSIIVHTLSNS